MSSAITHELLLAQDDRTSNAVLALLKDNAAFARLSASEGALIIQRDAEDEAKLGVGIQISIKRGVLSADPDVSPVKKIDVVGKSADEVAALILADLPGKEGNVLVLQGLSGTGKGTTVKKLQALLPKCVCWSNGNVFRTITHLANAHSEEAKVEFNADLLSTEFVAKAFSRLTFEKFDDGFDVVIDGATRVSAIQNTVLKTPLISSRVPTVAEQTQGEVVKFAASAVATLTAAGHNVILEGRAQTLNYIPTPHRYELVIPDVSLLGQRRAAQRVMAAAVEALKGGSSAAEDDVTKAIVHAAETLH